jgi:hypothetical protein
MPVVNPMQWFNDNLNLQFTVGNLISVFIWLVTATGAWFKLKALVEWNNESLRQISERISRHESECYEQRRITAELRLQEAKIQAQIAERLEALQRWSEDIENRMRKAEQLISERT